MAHDLLDLHGRKVDEVWPLLDKFLREAEAQGLKQVRIMTGKGTGKVREEALRGLKFGGYAPKPEKLKNGTINDGVFLVYL